MHENHKIPDSKNNQSLSYLQQSCIKWLKHQCLSFGLNVRGACDVVVHFLRHNPDMKLNTHLKSIIVPLFYAESPIQTQTACDLCWGAKMGLIKAKNEDAERDT